MVAVCVSHRFASRQYAPFLGDNLVGTKGRVAPRFVASALQKKQWERDVEQRSLLHLGLGLWSLLLRRRRNIGRASILPSTATVKELPIRVQVGHG